MACLSLILRSFNITNPIHATNGRIFRCPNSCINSFIMSLKLRFNESLRRLSFRYQHNCRLNTILIFFQLVFYILRFILKYYYSGYYIVCLFVFFKKRLQFNCFSPCCVLMFCSMRCVKSCGNEFLYRYVLIPLILKASYSMRYSYLD